MKCKLSKIAPLSGNKASTYSVIIDNDSKTLFEHFIEENFSSHLSEINSILARLKTIANKTGAREHFFKLNEGIPGDGVCALYDEPNKKLRLYCIRFGTQTIILGGGGEKIKTARTFQEIQKLKDENYLLRQISQAITHKIKERELYFGENDMDFIGSLEFYIED